MIALLFTLALSWPSPPTPHAPIDWQVRRAEARAASQNLELVRAADLLRSAISDARKYDAPIEVRAVFLEDLAKVRRAQEKSACADRLYRKALNLRIAHFGAEDPRVANGLDALGGFLVSTGRSQEGLALLRRGLALRERKLGPENPDVAKSLDLIALSLTRIEDVEPLLRRSLQIRKKSLAGDDPNTAFSLIYLGGVLREVGRISEAEEYENQANEILRLCRENRRTDCED